VQDTTDQSAALALPRDLVDEALRLIDRFAGAPPEDYLGARFDAGLAWLHLAPGDGGRDLDPQLQGDLERLLHERGGADPFPRNPIGIGMVAPTIARHGTPDQRAHLRRIFTGEDVWCQLFSEPDAGSDLASLATRARRAVGGWSVSGQKVWTSLGHRAAYGLLLARTDPDVPKHRGLTAFLLDMHAPGVEVRPLRQITGDAEFNEVFLHDVALADSAVLGEVGDGWRTAITTLANERVAIGGAVAKHASKPVEALLSSARTRAEGLSGAARDVVVRRWIEAEVLRLTTERARQLSDAGRPGPAGSVGKLAGAELNQRLSESVVDLRGAHGTIWDPDDAQDPVRRFLRARANTIEGGTSEVMRNVLGERVLGLPPEPKADAGKSWAESNRRSQPDEE
jgi:alkylation response protein AidB-like acyl-CoA dehydrogenase